MGNCPFCGRAYEKARFLGLIDRKLDQVLALLSRRRPRSSTRYSLPVEELLTMPDHLRQTVMALDRLGRGTSEQVAKRTGRARALENSVLL